MDDWQTVIVALVKRLTPWLALAALLFLAGILLWSQIDVAYRPLPFLFSLLVIVLGAVVELRKAGLKRPPEAQDNTQQGGGVIATGGRNLVIQIIQGYRQEQPGAAANLEDHLIEYLDWVSESFGEIVLRGIEQEGRQSIRLPLDRVYVPLQAEVTPDEMEREVVAVEPYPLTGRHEVDDSERAEPRTVLLSQVLGVGRRLIITGGPGSGKSTVLQHIAWTLACALRGNQPSLAVEKLGLHAPLPLPVYVPLSEYAAYRRRLPAAAGGKEKSLATFISEYMLQRQMHLDLPPDFLSFLIREQKQILLLLDGLDEVPNERERIAVRGAIDDLVSGREALQVLVTSRSAAYQGRAVLGKGFRHLKVRPLEPGHIDALVRQAYRAIYPQSDKLQQDKADDLLAGIEQLEAARTHRLGDRAEPLVTSPLMVRLFLIVHFNHRRLPDQRADLYQKAVDAMLRPDYLLDENAADEIEHRIGGSLAMNRDMLQHLAFQMHCQGADQGREVDQPALERILSAEPTYQPFVQELIEQTRQRNTLLEERGGFFRFIHLSFQEFLAARYIAINYDTDRAARTLLDSRVTDSRWREPCLLLFGYLDITAPVQARRLLLRLAGLDEPGKELAGDRSSDTCIAAVEMAAAAFLECQNQAADLTEPLKERLKLLLWQRDGDFPKPVLRAAAADALGALGWLPDDLHTFVRIPAAPGLPAFAIGKYPVTNAQYERFVNADDFADSELWMNFPMFGPDSQPLDENWGDKGWNWLQSRLKDPDFSPDGQRSYPRFWRDIELGIIRRGAPVAVATWYEANAYCRWLVRHWNALDEGRQNSGWQPQTVRLPLEAEWQYSAGGIDPEGRFPWDVGGATTELSEILKRANVREGDIGRTMPVGMYPMGASAQPFGLHDLAGNVWEWQANFYNKDNDSLVLRGGSFDLSWDLARVSVRLINPPDLEWLSDGFRVVALPG